MQVNLNEYRLMAVELSAFTFSVMPKTAAPTYLGPITLDKLSNLVDLDEIIFIDCDLVVECEFYDNEIEVSEILLELEGSHYPIQDHISKDELRCIKETLVSELSGL